MHITSKLPDTGTTIFSKMSALAAQHGAVNLSQGFPDFMPDPALLQHLEQAVHNNMHQYAPMAGNMALRTAIGGFYETHFQSTYNADTEITITAGATQALATAILALVSPGDEVLLFAPAYDCYAPMIAVAGGIPVYVTLEHPTYHINWEVVKQQLSPKTKAIVINSPHNPTGSILQPTDLEALKEITRGTNTVILADEVYGPIVFDGRKHLSFAGDPELKARSFVMGSFGKSFHITGWKVGYCCAPALLMQEFRKVHQYLVFSVSSVQQAALAAYMPTANWADLQAGYQSKRDAFLHLMRKTPFKPLR